jgi:CcmD family protein
MLDLARWLVSAALWLRGTVPAATEGGYRDVVPVEQVSAPLYVGLAYGVIWVVLAAYLLHLWRRQGRLAARVDALQRELDEADATPGARR